ncbi:type II toxin-antitoxin system RelE/ParE family toxin [Maribellus comscasis]|uniref:Type II toxin-antitoxin system RelE/ParE family toxin n=1 Tax=Maribellus comscasis TaxID=2681766 RepID=A0A6I6K938_9BACT|nr:type II toxin-antitoxin system RelE/ParE family toxin [Maribellus comscasis]QGY46584.1 type II toxin-antitoxin system RelE/ParE family toxin [Maribellus comscasis]
MEVIWSSQAKITWFNILDYLDKNWTKREIKQFIQRTEIIIRTIKKNPGIFPNSLRYKNVKKAVVDKNNSFFYQVDKKEQKIYILTFFDNRQNPERLKIEKII